MKKLMTKLSIVAAVGLVAVLPAPASAASGSIACPPDEVVRTYVGGTGYTHYHILNSGYATFGWPTNDTIYTSSFTWSGNRSGNWQTYTSNTTTSSSAACVY